MVYLWIIAIIFLSIRVAAEQCNSPAEEERKIETSYFEVGTGTGMIWNKIITDMSRDTFWAYGMLTSTTYKTVLMKSSLDFVQDWSYAIDVEPYSEAFTVTPNGRSMFFSPVQTPTLVYQINATNGNYISRMTNSETFDSKFKLYAHSDSSAIYLELSGTYSMI
jgi:hypothetical protein